MRKPTICVCLVAFGLALASSAVSAQSALTLAKLDALDDRLIKLEQVGVGDAAHESSLLDSSDLDGAVEALRAHLGALTSEVDALESEMGAMEKLEARVEDLARALTRVENALAREERRPEPEAGSVESDLVDLLAELRIYLTRAEELEASQQESPITITGQLHSQFSTASSDVAVTSEFGIRRARITAALEINDLVTGKIQPDFGAGKISLKDAYFKLSFHPAFRVTVGQFKRPFDAFALTSSTKTLVIENAGTIRGVDTCAGPGGICSYDRFVVKLGYGERDTGLLFDGELTPRWTYMASVTNGEGANHAESNGTKSYGARLEYAAMAGLTLAGNVAQHDYENDIDEQRTHAFAYGVDVEWGSYGKPGWHVVAGATAGENWMHLDEAGKPGTFRTGQAIVTHYWPLPGTSQLSGIEPIGRVSWGDPDRERTDDAELFTTAGVVIHFVGRNKLAVNVESWSPAVGDREWSLKVQSYLHF